MQKFSPDAVRAQHQKSSSCLCAGSATEAASRCQCVVQRLLVTKVQLSNC